METSYLLPIALIGFMGVGKSAVGRQLARMLDYEFVDTDRLVENRVGCTIAELFDSMGESEFRRCEAEVLLDALSIARRVISTGGGLPLCKENQIALSRHAAVVSLTALPEVILQRVQPLEKRPLLVGYSDPLERIKNLLRDRAGIYQLHDFTVDTSNLRPHQVAEIIQRWYLDWKESVRNA